LTKDWKRTSTATGFRFFTFDLEYLKRVQSSELLHTKIPLILEYFFGTWVLWAQTAIFFAQPVSKNAGESTIVLGITARE
jgi:hypothetical protein